MEPTCLICGEYLSRCTCSQEAKEMRRRYCREHEKQLDAISTRVSQLNLELELKTEQLENTRAAYRGSVG